MCGRNEVNFQYTSNVNGCVTETSLCAHCAAKSGYDLGQMFNFGNTLFGGSQPAMNGWNSQMPTMMSVMGFGMPYQITAKPSLSAQTDSQSCGCSCGGADCAPDTNHSEVDELMRKRRELYVQMHEAAEREEFERAAQLRDEIKALESEN